MNNVREEREEKEERESNDGDNDGRGYEETRKLMKMDSESEDLRGKYKKFIGN